MRLTLRWTLGIVLAISFLPVILLAAVVLLMVSLLDFIIVGEFHFPPESTETR